MPHSRLKASSSSVAGASCVFCFSLSAPRSELDLPLLRLPLRSPRPSLSSSSDKLFRDRLGDMVRSRVLPLGGMYTGWRGGSGLGGNFNAPAV